MINQGMMSSNKDDWETPQYFFDELNKHFEFVCDMAADEQNHKTPNYFTKESDALNQDWRKIGGGGWLWCNPPYGRELRHWVKKASESNANVVMLIPARTDTSYWHDYIFGKAKIVFLRGRLKFEIGGKPSGTAPFPSALVIFKEEE